MRGPKPEGRRPVAADLLAIQIDGMHAASELTLLAAVGIER
jgi:hypothetical protein